MAVADLWCGERVNPEFRECKGRNLEMFFEKPRNVESFISRVKEVAKDSELIAVPGCIVEKKFMLPLLPLLRKSPVAVAPYYHSPRTESIERSKHVLEKYGIKARAEFLPTYDPRKGIVFEDDGERFVDAVPVSPLGELDSGERGEIARVLEILAKTEVYSRYYRRDIWERFMNTEFVFSASHNFEKFLEIVSCYQQRCARWMRSKVSAMAMRTLPLKLGFHFQGGVAIDIEEFCRFLKEMGEDEFEEYMRRGDFSKWIEDVLGDITLAEKVRKCRSRDELLRVIEDRICRYEAYF